MSPERTTLTVFTLIFLGLLFINPVVFKSVGEFLTFGTSASKTVSQQELQRKISEMRAGESTPQNANFALGNVYSRYPQNLKNELLVDVGEESNVIKGGFAISEGVLIGRIIETENNMSIVQTVFDPEFNLAVRIGKSKSDGLLKGGVLPSITMISKNAEIQPNDPVYSASKDFAYGLPLGTVGAIVVGQNKVFSESDLVLSYSPAELRTLALQKK